MTTDILATYRVQPDHIPWAAGSSKTAIQKALSQVMDCDLSDADAIRDAARVRLADAVGSAAYVMRIDAGDTTRQAEKASDEGEIIEWLTGGNLMDIAEITTLDEAARTLAAQYLADDAWSPRTARDLTCLHCGHVWRPLRGRPALCPRCKSRNWDKAPMRPGRPAAAHAGD